MKQLVQALARQMMKQGKIPSATDFQAVPCLDCRRCVRRRQGGERSRAIPRRRATANAAHRLQIAHIKFPSDCSPAFAKATSQTRNLPSHRSNLLPSNKQAEILLSSERSKSAWKVCRLTPVRRTSGNTALKGTCMRRKIPRTRGLLADMGAKAKNQRTPPKTPEEKQDETVLAAKEESIEGTNKRKGYQNVLRKLDDVQPGDLTVPQFMTEFDVAIKKLAADVPKNNSDEARAVFESKQKTATQDVATQGENHSRPLRDAANQDPSNYPDKEKEKATGYKLEPDPPGNVPAIKQAKAAAPKPETDKVISLDDKSRELDDALQNHDVGGQKINIDEGSLAFPVSGEKSFDEAGESKRQAQAEIAKAKPKYRQEEKGVISKSQNDIDSLVNVRGLQGHHGLRSAGFKKVLGSQEKHKTNIKSVKETFLEKVEGIYKDTKDEVNEALDSLHESETIDKTLEDILTDADTWFKWWTRNEFGIHISRPF